jgi:hypothetical protein
MAADILSLSKARKAKARSEHESAAQRNRMLHGRTKAEKLKDILQKVLAERRIEAHRIGRKPGGEPDA